MKCREASAFTLVELTIVLVITGLLVGGVLVGQTIYQSAGLQRTVKWQLAMKSEFDAFTDKYQAYPGDMPNATTFWGRSSLAGMNCASQAGTASATGTCNGDGNGSIYWGAIGGTAGEEYWVIHHLELAGMDTTPLNGSGVFPTNPSPYFLTPGQNAAAWSFIGGYTPYADLYSGAVPSGSPAQGIALQTASFCSGYMDGGAATGVNTLYMDTKADDGMPTSGAFQASNGAAAGSCGTLGGDTNCLTLSNGSYIYNATATTTSCRFLFLLVQK